MTNQNTSTLGHTLKNEGASAVAVCASLVSAAIAASACIGPLAGIALGVSGLGWLTQFSYMTIPASVLSITLLVAAFYLFLKRRSSCANRRKHAFYRAFLGLAALLVIAINIVEYLVIPNLS